MLRERLREREQGWEPHFHWRGGNVSRIENLSDAVFAFALTLLVVSTEVPRTFAELKEAFWQLPVFAACFAVLVWCWYGHYKFFRRYGLEDVPTVALNGVLLFVVLFYVFPLKFLAAMLLRLVRGLPANEVAGPNGEALQVFAQAGEPIQLMVIYGAGFSGVFLLLAVLYRHAWSRREALELSEVERLLTRGELSAHLLSAAVGLLSIALALVFGGTGFVAGIAYFLLGPLHWLHGVRQERRLRALPARSSAS